MYGWSVFFCKRSKVIQKVWRRQKLDPNPEPGSEKKMNALENLPVGKTGSQGLKMLSFVSNHMKDNVELIHSHIKGRVYKAIFSCK